MATVFPPAVPLEKLLEEVGIACQSTQGRLRRMNAFMFAHHVVMASVDPCDRDKATEGMLRIAQACGLIEYRQPNWELPSEADRQSVRDRLPRITTLS